MVKSFSRLLFIIIIFLCMQYAGTAATITSNSVTGNWNAAGTWVGGVPPGAGDDVVIAADANITVTVNASCKSITWTGTPGATVTLTINSGITLTVTEGITLDNTTAVDNINRQISVLGTLICASISMANTSGSLRDILISIGTAGIVTVSGNIVMAGIAARNHIDMTGNAVINIGGHVGGDATASVQGGGFVTPTTINMNGTSAQNFFPTSTPTYTLFKVNNTAGVFMQRTTTITTLTIGDITANSILDDNGFQITSTGTLNLQNTSFFRLGSSATATVFPDFSTVNFAVGTTVEYDATPTQTISVSPTYIHLTLSGGSKTIAAGTLNIDSNLVINTGATFNGSINNPAIDIAGNFSNSGTFTSGTGLFRMNGINSQAITSSSSLTFSGSVTIFNTGDTLFNFVTLGADASIAGNLTLSDGVFDIGSFTANRATSGGTLTISNGAWLRIGGVRSNRIPSNYTTHSIGANSTIDFYGTNQDITVLNSGQSYGNLRISGTLANTDDSFSLSGTLTIENGSDFTCLDGTVTMNSNLSKIVNNNPTDADQSLNREIVFRHLTIAVTPSSQSQYNANIAIADNFTVNVGVTFAPTSGIVDFFVERGAIIANGTITFNHLTISRTPTSQTQFNASYSVARNFRVGNEQVFAPTGGTVTMSSVNSAIVGAGTKNFYNLTIAQTPNNASTQYNTSFGVSQTLTVSPGVTFSPNGTITMLSTSSSIAGTGTKNFNNLIIAASNAAPSNYSENFTVNGTLTINSSVGFTPNNTITMGAAASAISNSGTLHFNHLTIAATPTLQSQYNATVLVAGTLSVNNSITFAPVSSTIEMSSISSTIINNGSLTFNNLVVSATPTSQAQYNTSFAVSGNLIVNGAVNFSPSGGTITMSGASNTIQNASGTLGFVNLLVSGTVSSTTGNFSVGTNLQVNGVFTPGAATVVSGAGTLNGSGTVTVTRTAATPSFGAQYTISNKTLSALVVDYNGAGDQSVNGENYGSLTISTNGTRTVTLISGETIRVSNVFTPTASNTTYVVTGNTFEYNGTGAQTVSAFTYYDLVITNNSNKTILPGTTVFCRKLRLNTVTKIVIPPTAQLKVTG